MCGTGTNSGGGKEAKLTAFSSVVVDGEIVEMSDDSDTEEAFIDSASNGNLLPISCMSDTKVVDDMTVEGISNNSLKITHEEVSEQVGGSKGWAPDGKKYLVSVP